MSPPGWWVALTVTASCAACGGDNGGALRGVADAVADTPDTTPAPDTSVAPDATDAPDTTVAPDTMPPEPIAEPGITVVGVAESDIAPTASLTVDIVWDGHADGDVVSVQWTIIRPVGAPIVMQPTAGGHLGYTATLAGSYRFDAVIIDRDGHQHVAKSFTINIVPPTGLYVQLSWHTPGDINEDDTGGDQIFFSIGSDMDLHLLHPKAAGDWFDWSYACYWDNVNPEWGVFSAVDNPRLDRDDTDGAGPEAIDLAEPEPGVIYRVGVHYWDDWGYGASWATLRVYWDGDLVDEWADVRMTNDDLWDAYTIDALGHATRVGEVPSITHAYREILDTMSITSVQGTAVPPGTTVDLHVVAHDASIASVEWSVTTPDGSTLPIPSGADRAATSFTLGGVGGYAFHALVTVSGGAVTTLELGVIAAATTDLRVELTWRTPADADESDHATGKVTNAPKGSDLDLHLLHPKAYGHFADGSFDCYYDDVAPEWGIFSPTDNPAYLDDDYDGGGPETIMLCALEPGAAYTVGVEYFRDHGFGHAFASVRVFLGGELQGEWDDVELSEGDQWSALKIVDGTVTRIGATPSIAHNPPQVPAP